MAEIKNVQSEKTTLEVGQKIRSGSNSGMRWIIPMIIRMTTRLQQKGSKK